MFIKELMVHKYGVIYFTKCLKTKFNYNVCEHALLGQFESIK